MIYDEIPYGSRVYGTHTEDSDYDTVTLVSNDSHLKSESDDNKVWTMDAFKEQLSQHYIIALEVWSYAMNDPERIFPNDIIGFHIDKSLLRREISGISNNAWVKAKKKINVEAPKYEVGSPEYDHEINLGMKSIFHSFRIIDFGIQLAEHGKIVDFSKSNSIFCAIKDMNADQLNAVLATGGSYHKQRNELLTKFRQLAPKE